MVESQLLAFQVVLIATFLPSFILSGFIFPISSMPAPIRAVTYIVPARYFLSALRGIVLKGVGLPVVWGSLVALTIYAIGVLGLASLRLARQRG
jgi:ABC-2 type transport system permease protein